MPVLTYNEGLAIEAIRHQSRHGDPVPAWVVRDRLLDRGVHYDAATRALSNLVKKDLAARPTRGYYLPVK